jgi:hypothetical protein
MVFTLLGGSRAEGTAPRPHCIFDGRRLAEEGILMTPQVGPILQGWPRE